MPQYVCTPQDLLGNTNCADLGGWYIAKYVRYSDVNWAAMLVDADLFDIPTRTIKEFSLGVGVTWKTIEPRGEGANYAFNMTRIARYDCTVNCTFDGKNKVRTKNIQEASLCCDLVTVLFCNNGEHRVVGVDFNGENFAKPYRNFNISTHNDNGGNIGSEGATDGLIMNGVQIFAPLFSSSPLSDF